VIVLANNATDLLIEIHLTDQRLLVYDNATPVFCCPVSTGANGPGEIVDSGCTPRGWHEICEKIGTGCSENTVFLGRVKTGELYSKELATAHPERDWILTRILWLSGREPGFNCGGNCDTRSRYIYLHGTPAETNMGVPGSHGCVRLSNSDVIRVYDMVFVGTRVNILE